MANWNSTVSQITRAATKSLLYVSLQLDQTFIILLSLEARGAKKEEKKNALSATVRSL